MKFCFNCGHDLSEDGKYTGAGHCMKCGAVVSTTALAFEKQNNCFWVGEEDRFFTAVALRWIGDNLPLVMAMVESAKHHPQEAVDDSMD